MKLLLSLWILFIALLPVEAQKKTSPDRRHMSRVERAQLTREQRLVRKTNKSKKAVSTRRKVKIEKRQDRATRKTKVRRKN